mmetsp:Transcript_3165/g.7076  ORF Transcript_3165/g.7076 Transcript_3165/m.7076 type:complete len:245 (+) Transcript_3165:212-946(+)
MDSTSSSPRAIFSIFSKLNPYSCPDISWISSASLALASAVSIWFTRFLYSSPKKTERLVMTSNLSSDFASFSLMVRLSRFCVSSSWLRLFFSAVDEDRMSSSCATLASSCSLACESDSRSVRAASLVLARSSEHRSSSSRTDSSSLWRWPVSRRASVHWRRASSSCFCRGATFSLSAALAASFTHRCSVASACLSASASLPSCDSRSAWQAASCPFAARDSSRAVTDSICAASLSAMMDPLWAR